MSKKRCIILCTSLALLLLTGCNKIDDTSSDVYQEKLLTEQTEKADTQPRTSAQELPADVVLTGMHSVEVYETLTVDAFIQESNVELQNGGDTLNTDKLGTSEVNVVFTYDDCTYEKKISYIVKDTTAPVLLNAGDGARIEVGTDFELNDYVGFGDNYDAVPKLTYSGSVDAETVGSYPLTATVEDSSGNQLSWDLTVQVVENIPEEEDNYPRLSFESFSQQYGGNDRQLGIDVSKWQGDIDFEAVKAAGCSFVIMRIGSYYDEIQMDAYFQANMAGAKAADLDVGVYFYTTANNEQAIKEQAAWIAEQLDGQTLDFPVAFDWESFSNYQQYEMSIHELNGLFEVFASEMEQHGYSAMLYSSKNFLNNFWDEHDAYPVWLAHYTDETDYSGSYAIWQMSSRGRIPGIAGDVDLNILYTDKMF